MYVQIALDVFDKQWSNCVSEKIKQKRKTRLEQKPINKEKKKRQRKKALGSHTVKPSNSKTRISFKDFFFHIYVYIFNYKDSMFR